MLTKASSIIALLAITLVISCNQNREQPPSVSSPKVVEAHESVLSKDSLWIPKIVAVRNPKVIKAGMPTMLVDPPNTRESGIPRVVKAGVPKICTPGHGGYSLPKKTPAIHKPFMAGILEVVAAEKPNTKDENPQSFNSFGKLEGLRNAEIVSMLEDRGGNLWLGTLGRGVIKYDGRNFTHFPQTEGLSNNDVWSIKQDKRGDLWFGTQGGAIKYDGRNFTRFTEREGLVYRYIWSIVEDKTGNLWFGTNGIGVSKYDGKQFTNFTEKEGLLHNTVHSIQQDKAGNLWLGTDRGVAKFDGKSFMHFTATEGLPKSGVVCILEDKRGNLWFGTNGGGVTQYDGQNFTHFTKNEGLINDTIRSLLEDKDGNIWIGTRMGLNKYDGKYFTHFTETEGLSNNVVRSIVEDRSGNLWFGTLGGGVSKYNGRTFIHFTDKDGLSSKVVRGIIEDKHGNLWFATNEGAVKCELPDVQKKQKRFLSFGVKEGLSSKYVRSMVEDKGGNLWFGTFGGGLNKYDGKSFTHIREKDGLIDDWLWNILADKSGNIWCAGGKGVSKFDGRAMTNFTMMEGLSDNFVISMLEDKRGNIWFGTKDRGVNKYDGKTFTHFTVKDGLSSNNVRSILEDESGNLWFGTGGGGLDKYDGKTFTHFTTRQGLSDDHVEALMEDKSGNLWVGTAYGVSRMDKKNKNSADGTLNRYFQTYTYEDGFTGVGVNFGKTLYEGKDGSIWIGADDRLTVFHPNEQTKDTTPPNLQLTKLTLFNENIAWQALLSSENKPGSNSDTSITLQNGVLVHDFYFDSLSKWYGVPHNLSLDHHNNYITFQFFGITLHSPNKVTYQYKLEGLDENWSPPTNRSEATYGNLPHGNYTFKVKAMNGDGYSSNELSYPFTIRPPWWHTWWAYSLFAVSFVGVIYSAFRYRLNQIRTQHEIELERHRAVELEMQALRAQMNPHFIFNSLNSINLFILENDKLRASEYLTKFSRLIRLILHNSREATIPLEKELEALDLYLELESLRFEERFKYKITVEDKVDAAQVKVPPLIIQPLAENAIWHGLMQKKEEGHLDIKVYQQEELLLCKITDDGIGRQKAAEAKNRSTSGGKSLGMRITANRIAILKNETENNNQIEVTDIVHPDGSPGGTEVLLKIPVHYD